ncbi:MAG: class I SAM-dependent methyltransferase [Candidatus Limnocylindria bacterium]
MRDETAELTAAAAMQAELWSERAEDWAELVESADDPWLKPIYEEVLDRLAVGTGTALLDVGCGAGRFARMASDRGARVSGIDITPTFIRIARRHAPQGDFRLGDLQVLPWAADTFDVITGFNSFFYAEDLPHALREAHRVARPAARLAMTAFGRPENSDFAPLFELLAEAVPAFAVEDDQTPPLEALLTGAGFIVELAEYRQSPETYPDMDTVVRGYLAIGPLRHAVRAIGEEQVADFMRTAFASRVRSDGSVNLVDEYRLLLARA